MKIAITGARGALGEAVRVAAQEAGHRVYAYHHGEVDIASARQVQHALREDKPEVVINCAGRIDRTAGRQALFWTNAFGPMVLSFECQQAGVPLIHVSTDCVFSGERPMYGSEYNGPKGPYPTDAEPDAPYRDAYGATKALGESMEPNSLLTVVRTSFITPRHGLVRWLRTELRAGRRVQGYQSVWWTGSSAWHVAHALVDLAADRPPGVVHLATPRAISKHEVLTRIADVYGLPHDLIEPAWNPILNRALVPTIELPPLDGTLSWPA